MASIKQRIRSAARRAGYQIDRYPQSDPLFGVSRILHHLAVTTVIDVGANAGQYAVDLRRLGYKGRIHSFEPVTELFDRLDRAASKDASWFVHEMALGSTEGEQEINIAGNHGASSSLLDMLGTHLDAAPESVYVGSQLVRVGTLDRVAADLDLRADDVIFVKMDVQGFEHEVLQGGRRLLTSTAVVGVQMELSLQELYRNGMLWAEGIATMEGLGFRIAGVNPGFSDRRTGELLQFDGVFVRK